MNILINGQVFGLGELGQTLKEKREEKGLSLDDIQEMTKIQKRYLVAIEAGEYAQLPGNFYTRAFIKNYAEVLGLDPKEIFALHRAELPQLETEHENDVTPTRVRRRSREVVPKNAKFTGVLSKVLIVLAIVVILIGVWFIAQKLIARGGDKPTDTDQGIVLKNGQNIGNGKVKTDPKAEDDNQSPPSQSNDEDKPSDDDKKTTEQSLKLDRSEGQTSHYTLSGTDRFDLNIDAKDGGASWITVAKGGPSGQRLYYSFVSKGVNNRQDESFHQDLSDQGTIYIKVGSVSSTVITINGQPFEFPDNGTVQQIYIDFHKEA
ncbi:helix-turn-helix domain-containing protein [Camelliibacillus cellulosilyticus]|uniref:Helix-turn-helix domain-containing protein n=1 Tax=Camelliibacillus cellulosilyticus TaxID=2174486 RepID=A0ABV9GGK8_9BACL